MKKLSETLCEWQVVSRSNHLPSQAIRPTLTSTNVKYYTYSTLIGPAQDNYFQEKLRYVVEVLQCGFQEGHLREFFGAKIDSLLPPINNGTKNRWGKCAGIAGSNKSESLAEILRNIFIQRW